MATARNAIFRQGELPDETRPLLRQLTKFADDVTRSLGQTRRRELMRLEVRTLDPVESTFASPYLVSVPAGMTVEGLHVVGARCLSSPATVFYDAIQIHWEPSGDGRLLVKFITGLDVSATYQLTLEAIGA